MAEIDTPPQTAPTLALKAHGALSFDADHGVVRLDPADMAKLGVRAGDVVTLKGPSRSAYARALPAPARFRDKAIILLDGSLRQNTGIGLGDMLSLTPTPCPKAQSLTLHVRLEAGQSRLPEDHICRALENVPVHVGDVIRVKLVAGRTALCEVTATEPSGPVLPCAETRVRLEADTSASDKDAVHSTYDDLGGLAREVERIREMVELPLRRPDLFAHLGVDAPKGVLFTGPPGTGKTLLARTVAQECDAAFFQINGPEIVSKHYGDSEARLRKVFEQASARAPSVIFIDEIDAIAPKRDSMAGDRQVERRIVAQLLTLLDGLGERGHVIVMAATNLPNSLDPALRRPGRFDREIKFGVPDKAGRREILSVHTRGMPLDGDVDLDALASATHGFVGADIAALAREAAMAALRRLIAQHEGQGENLTLSELIVTQEDFETALREVGPSAIRETFTDIPEVSWSDVGGCDSAKTALIEAVIWPLAHDNAFRHYGVDPLKGVLLCGPPGTGKTLMAKALAHEAGVNFIAVRGPQLLNQYVGEAERAVRDVFAKARMAAPCIIFFDEVDALAPRRGHNQGAVLERVVAQLLTEIDGIDELKGVFLLAATNRIDQIDPAFLRPGRLDLMIELGAPDHEARLQILYVHTRALPLGADCDLEALAQTTQGLVGADIKALCQTAARLAMREALANASSADTPPDLSPITAAHFAQALEERHLSDSLRTSPPQEGNR